MKVMTSWKVAMQALAMATLSMTACHAESRAGTVSPANLPAEAQPIDGFELLAETSEAARQFAALLPSLVTTPRQAVAATLFLQLQPERRADRERWLGYARQHGGNDPLVQMVLGSQVTRSIGRKQMEHEALARLKSLEPDNAYAWLLAMALEAEGSDATLAALRQAGRATRYDDHWRELERELYQLAKHWPRSPREKAMLGEQAVTADADFVHARGIMSALWMPGFQRLVETCKAPTADVLADCRHVATLLAADDRNLVEHGVGIAMLKRLETDPQRVAALEEQSRVMRWRQARMVEFNLASGRELLANGPDDVIYLMEYGEQAALLRALEREGLPAFPPDDWRPGSAR
jgi:hypothetical protein